MEIIKGLIDLLFIVTIGFAAFQMGILHGELNVKEKELDIKEKMLKNMHRNEKTDCAVDIDEVIRHYDKAVSKHPFFANDLWIKKDPRSVMIDLELERTINSASRTYATRLAREEELEAEEAYFRGEPDRAVDEIYDIIAVWLRAVDMIKSQKCKRNE